MSNAFLLVRSLIIYGICLPLAIFLGYLLATPLDKVSMVSIGIILALLSLPLFLRWHYPWMLFCWNANAILFILPGSLQFAYFLIGVSLSISLLQYILNRKLNFLSVPSVTWPLCFLLFVVLLTARLNGGIGLNTLGGDSVGGRRYILLLVGIFGYFALTSRQIPPGKATLYVSLFFVGALTSVIGSFVQFVNPALYGIFLIFPPEIQGLQMAAQDVASVSPVYVRFAGLSVACTGVVFVLLARYGIRGTFDLKKYWRGFLFITCVILSLFGGYRSVAITVILTFAILFYLEGLMRSRMLPILLLVSILGGILTLAFVDKLPLAMQRSLSFVPMLKIDPIAEMDAKTSSEWRLQMWSYVLPEVPKYLILGKGYSFTAAELSFMRGGMRGSMQTGEGSAIAGDYHNGPLSLVMPFGIFGVAGFLWFITASFKVLYRNYKHGDPTYYHLNAFLLTYFIVKTIFFFFIFGSLYTDILCFTGAVGLSIALNGGVSVPLPQPVTKQVFGKFKLAGATR